jgi:hypothetical protein
MAHEKQEDIGGFYQMLLAICKHRHFNVVAHSKGQNEFERYILYLKPVFNDATT